MSERLIADSNAIIDLLRPDRTDPPPLASASEVLLPLHVAGELFAGAHYSDRAAENVANIEALIARWPVLHPDVETARVYGRLRSALGPHITHPRMNDVWIAALAIQHSLPLLTNDRGFDVFPELRTIHW